MLGPSRWEVFGRRGGGVRGGERAGAMRGIVRRCSHARVDIDLRSAASGTAFSMDDLHAHVRHRHRCAGTDQRLAPEGGGEAPQIRGTILYLGFVFTLFDQKERSGLSSVERAAGAGPTGRKLNVRGVSIEWSAPDVATGTIGRRRARFEGG